MSPVADHGQRFRAELGSDHPLDRLNVLPGRSRRLLASDST
ncbi:hypothetical protein QX204_07750 [Nocardia sp. PE-7]|nr:hypothetical protein [Nocardia sp. PE-7]WKG11341.1 hypothetical protein QX204_07750 [Nocardia sp. PE-7]